VGISDHKHSSSRFTWRACYASNDLLSGPITQTALFVRRQIRSDENTEPWHCEAHVSVHIGLAEDIPWRMAIIASAKGHRYLPRWIRLSAAPRSQLKNTMPDNNNIGASANSNLRFIEFPGLLLVRWGVPTPQQMHIEAKASPSCDLCHTGARAAGLPDAQRMRDVSEAAPRQLRVTHLCPPRGL
jgi:hypothetical protein